MNNKITNNLATEAIDVYNLTFSVGQDSGHSLAGALCKAMIKTLVGWAAVLSEA